MRPLALLLVLAACAPADPAAPEAAAPEAAAPEAAAPEDAPSTPVAEAPTGPDTLSITTDAVALAARPTAPLRVDGACPFEGCTYGTWTTSAETTLYATPDAASATFTVPAGTALKADRGFVLLTALGAAVARRASNLYLADGTPLPVAEGDTLVVLDYSGEGSSRVWADGQLGYSEAGGDVGPPGEGPAFERLAEPASAWWAHVTTPDGRAGWLWMEETPDVTGADALG